MMKVKGMRDICVALVILVAFTARSVTVASGLGRGAANALKTFFTGDGIAATNLALGTVSRSIIINSATEQMRGDGITEISEGLQQAIVTLTVLDIGGGALVPIADKIIDKITNDRIFAATREAFKTEADDAVGNMLNFIKQHSNKGYQRGAREYLKAKKLRIERAFQRNIQNIMNDDVLRIQNKNILKHIAKVKKLFKLKFVMKALGPIFDLVNIGVSAWSLATAVRDCVNDYVKCNVGAIAATSLCIISGVVGIIAFVAAGTAFGPVGTVIAIVLAITATLIEMFYVPPTDPEAELFREHAKRMFQMDSYSRLQLESASKFIWESGLQNTDLYVVNQGHLPNWMEMQQSELRGPLTFGLANAGTYDSEGRVKARIHLPGKCDLFHRRGPDKLPDIGPGDMRCEYYQEGREDIKLTNRMTNGEEYQLGPDFYGIPQNWREGHEGPMKGLLTSPIAAYKIATFQRPPYEGAMILVNTNNVTNERLVNLEGPNAKTTNTKLRGLDINTEQKFAGKPLNERSNFNDVVALGDMRNLGRRNKVKIRTGRGRDVLNIDGWVYNLDADLGVNHNTLSFRGMTRKRQPEREGRRDDWPEHKPLPAVRDRAIFYREQLRGIRFNPQNGEVRYKPYKLHETRDIVIPTTLIGHVRGVGILNASPFDGDEIKLFAVQKDDTNPDDHFTVFKFKGNAVYGFDARSYKSNNFEGVQPHFKIIDGTEGGENCRHKPKLRITNLHANAEEKDVQFKYNKIHIYLRSGERGESRELGATVSFFTHCPGRVIAEDQNYNVKISERAVSDLDIMEYTGSRFVYSFGADRPGSRGDILYVRCPEHKVTSMRTTSDISTIVISGEFLDNCDIDEENDVRVSKRRDTVFRFQFRNNVKFEGAGRRQKFVGVQRIVNELGVDIVDLDNTSSFKLFEAYASKTGEAMVDQSQLQPVVKNNIKACIIRAANQRRKRNGEDIKRSEVEDDSSDFTEAELGEYCE